ncbi:MAG: long-chain fatty acid--CoA ligase [Myxococcota bacterium]
MATQFQSLADMFLHRVQSTPDKPAFRHVQGGSWKTLSWKETGERARDIACGLRALGLQDEQRVALMSSTRLDWILADLGINLAGGATTTIYPSSTPDDCQYIINDSETVFVFAENDDHVNKLASQRDQLKNVKHIITFDGKAGHDGWVIPLSEVVEKGKAHHAANPDEYEKIARAVKNDALSTLIYTSGTTGRPKGVELTHDCWVFEAAAIASSGAVDVHDVQYLWLPLSHVFGKVLLAGQIYVGFETAVDGRIDKLVEHLGQVKPTLVAAVPRIFEKVHNKIVQGAKEGGAAKAAIFQWAVKVGLAVSQVKQQGKQPAGLLAVQYALADKLVFSKIRDRFGGRIRVFVSGSAPLSRYMAEFFHAAGMLILEGYGLTESGAASCVNRPDRFKFGTVGLPLDGVQVKLAPDGEILLKSRGVMRGYKNLPEVTAETLEKDGWLHTGDIGEVDSDGFLRITDRKKDLIKTSGGKYVAPQALEGKFKAICPYVSQIVVHGDNRNYCSALVAMEEESTKKWAAENGITWTSYAQMAEHPKVVELFQGAINQLNEGLASYESIKKFKLLPNDLTEASGDLTPSLKLKRKAVEKKYKAMLDSFYTDEVAKV